MKSLQNRIINACSIGIEASEYHIKFLQDNINEWQIEDVEKNDLATRCAQMQLTINTRYGDLLKLILIFMDTECKHPKKCLQKAGDVTYCANCNQDINDTNLVKKILKKYDIKATLKRIKKLEKMS